MYLTPSPSPSVKIQIMGGKVGFMCKGKTLLSVVNKLFCPKRLLTMPSNVLWKIKTKNSNVHDVMGSNPGYLSKSSLLYFAFSIWIKSLMFHRISCEHSGQHICWFMKGTKCFFRMDFASLIEM